MSQVSARKNLNETAFFFPHLLCDTDGTVRMEFTMPEALTQWKFLGFAHDTGMRSGYLTDSIITAKDLMVEPNPPRFVREGDVIVSLYEDEAGMLWMGSSEGTIAIATRGSGPQLKPKISLPTMTSTVTCTNTVRAIARYFPVIIVTVDVGVENNLGKVLASSSRRMVDAILAPVKKA